MGNETRAKGLLKQIQGGKRATPINYSLPIIKEATNDFLDIAQQVSQIDFYGNYDDFRKRVREICEKKNFENIDFWSIGLYNNNAGRYVPNNVVSQIQNKSDENCEVIESFLISKVFDQLINTQNNREAEYLVQIATAFFDNRNTIDYREKFYKMLGRRINTLEERQKKEYDFEKRKAIKERFALIENLIKYTQNLQGN